MNTAEKLGTSLEVLAPYLPYGLMVQHTNENGAFTLEVVAADFEDHEVYCRDVERKSEWTFRANEVLPVLRDFSQLTVPLPTGEVPAVEVAKLAFSNNENIAFDEANMHDLGGALGVNFSDLPTPLLVIGKKNWTVTWMDSDMTANPIIAPAAVIDYLRSKHFALPVNGRPLVANVDYIPLTAPSTPTREADNNPTTII